MMKQVNSCKEWFVFGAMLAVCMLIAPKQSDAITISGSGGRSVWELLVTDFAEVDIAGQLSDYEVLSTGSALTLSDGSMFFDDDIERRQVPGSWTTWSGGETPAVLMSYDDALGTTFSHPVSAFGFEMEPDIFQTFTMTLLLGDGSTTSQLVEGDSGATFFGWVGEDVVSMDMTCATDCSGFAIGRMVQEVQGVPEPATLLLLGSGFLGFGLFRRMRKES